MKKILQHITALLVASLAITSAWAQCYPDRHNTSWNEAWKSCETAPNPNPERGNGHWVMYDLQHIYELTTTTFWNINDPEHLNDGANEIVIDYSQNGVDWEEWGSFFLAQANGSSLYEGVDGPDLSNVDARYLIITILSNHGGSCSGISEFRANVEGTVESVYEETVNDCLSVAVYPNPFAEQISAEIKSDCQDAVQCTIYDAMGRLVHTERLSNGLGTQVMRYENADMPAGIYYLEVAQGNNRSRHTIVRMQR